MARIVIVDDEENVADPLADRLRALGHEVQVYGDGREALTPLMQHAPDILVLDVMLPGLDGLEVCRRIRPLHPHLPILMLSARCEELDRVLGLECGADDYVVKPFSLREMEARVRGWLRRTSTPAPACGERLEAGPFVLDRSAGVFKKNGREVELARREMELLSVLMERKGQMVPREELLQLVWGADFTGEPKTLDVNVRWLRLKLEDDPAAPVHLVTVRGRGFRFDA